MPHQVFFGDQFFVDKSLSMKRNICNAFLGKNIIDDLERHHGGWLRLNGRYHLCCAGSNPPRSLIKNPTDTFFSSWTSCFPLCDGGLHIW